MTDRILLFISAYRCAPQIPRVLEKFTAEYRDVFSHILVIDNQSPDDTVPRATEAAKALFARTGIPISVLQNVENVSLGGTHKVAFNYALAQGYDYVCILHGDDQGDVADLVKAIRSERHKTLDFYLGSRFLPQSQLVGYAWWRVAGNHVFNFLFSLVVRRRLADLGSGMNIFKVSSLQDRMYLRFPNRLTFNYYLTLWMCAEKMRFDYFPHRWSEDDQVSNLKLLRAVREIMLLLMKYMKRGKRVFAELPADGHTYQTTVIYDSQT